MSNSIFKYLTPSEESSVRARDMYADVSASMAKAVDANLGGTLYLEEGYYRGTFHLPETITIEGAGWGFMKKSPWTSKCALVNRTPGTPTITIDGGVYHQGVTLRGFNILGHGSSSATPNGNTDDGIVINGEGQHLVEELQVLGCGGYGMRVCGTVDKAVISRCRVAMCSKGGIRVVKDADTDRINHITITLCELDTNYADGLQMFASNLVNVINNTIQGNAGRGIAIVPSDTLLTPKVFEGANISLNHFENNKLGNIYGLTYAVERVAHIYGLNIDHNRFIQAGTPNVQGPPDIQLIAHDGSDVHAMWRGCHIDHNYHSGSNHVWIDLGNVHGRSTTLELPQYLGQSFDAIFKGLGINPANPVTILGKF